MAKTRQQKEQAVQQLADNFKSAKSVVFANFQGLKVRESEELRGRCRESEVIYLASKKTLVNRALAQAGYEVDLKPFVGGVAAVFGVDEVAPAQVIANFAKEHAVVTIFGGIMEGKFIDAAKVAALAKLPSKTQLLAQFVGTLNAPVAGFVNVLAGTIRGLANVLTAIKAEKSKSIIPIT